MRLYEWAVIFEGTKDKDGEWTEKPELLKLDTTLADSENQAQIIAARAIPDKYLERLDRVSIAVRPF